MKNGKSGDDAIGAPTPEQRAFLEEYLAAVLKVYGYVPYEGFIDSCLRNAPQSPAFADFGDVTIDAYLQERESEEPPSLHILDSGQATDSMWIVGDLGINAEDADPDLFLELKEIALKHHLLHYRRCGRKEFTADELFKLADTAKLLEPKTATIKAIDDLLARALHETPGAFSADRAQVLVSGIRNRPCQKSALAQLLPIYRLDRMDDADLQALALLLSDLLYDIPGWDFGGHSFSEMLASGRIDPEPSPRNMLKQLEKLVPNAKGSLDSPLQLETGDAPQPGAPDVRDGRDYDACIFDDSSGCRDIIEENLALVPPSIPSVRTSDFRFVKDPAARQRLLDSYALVRTLIKNFIEDRIFPALTPAETNRMRELSGEETFQPSPYCEDTNDSILTWFAALMGTADGEPCAVKRVLDDPEDFSQAEKKIAPYFANLNNCWLVVQAVKSGLGMKCRNLMTGDDVFLVLPDFSTRQNIKGKTIFADIAPMGNCYVSTGYIASLRLPDPEAALKQILEKLDIPYSLPLELSYFDQVRLHLAIDTDDETAAN